LLEDEMAGVKGRSGGARPGAGRKRKVVTRAEQREQIVAEEKQATAASLGIEDPREFLLAAMQSKIPASPQQMDAAKALLPYFHPKLGETGKKENQRELASKAGQGVFARSPPPQGSLFKTSLN
jgi:phage terminase small subunit